ncbi:sodium:calcium antiporter [Candidatus Woesearchaeota archaeon]|nr:sodium:calcium antiporter [Candidatus Woesearchaeota archaeon]
MSTLLGLSLIALLSLFVMIKSADYVVAAIIRYARKTGISDYLIGFLVVAFGTTLPDIVTGVNASFQGASILVIGDVLGSSILDMTVVLGMMAIAGRIIPGDRSLDWKSILRLFVLICLPFVLALDGTISRVDGIALILVFLLYVYALFRHEEEKGAVKEDVPFAHIGMDMLVFAFGIVALLLAGRWLIFSLIGISQILRLPVLLLGLFILSAAMTMPEFFVAIRSVRRRHDVIAFGDLLGAITNNLLFVVGIAAVIRPIPISLGYLAVPAAFMLGTLGIGVYFITRKAITWKHGIFFVALYGLFILAEALW